MTSRYRPNKELTYDKTTHAFVLRIEIYRKNPLVVELSEYQQKYFWIAHKTPKFRLRLDEATKAIKNISHPEHSRISEEFTEEWLERVISQIERESAQVSDPRSHWFWVVQPDPYIEEQIRQSQEEIDDAKMDHFEDENGSIVLTLQNSKKSQTKFSPREQKFIYHALAHGSPQEVDRALPGIGFRHSRGTGAIKVRMYPELKRYIDTQRMKKGNTPKEQAHWAMLLYADSYTVSDIHKLIGKKPQGAMPAPPRSHSGHPNTQVPATNQSGQVINPGYVPNPPQHFPTGSNPGTPASPYYMGQTYPMLSHDPRNPSPAMYQGQGKMPEATFTSNYQGYTDPQTGSVPTTPGWRSESTSSSAYSQYRHQRGTSNAPPGVAMTPSAPPQVQRAVKTGSAPTALLRDQGDSISGRERRSRMSQAQPLQGQEAGSYYTGEPQAGYEQPAAGQHQRQASRGSTTASTHLEPYEPLEHGYMDNLSRARRSRTPADRDRSSRSRRSSPRSKHLEVPRPISGGHREQQDDSGRSRSSASGERSSGSRGSSPNPPYVPPKFALKGGVLDEHVNMWEEKKKKKKRPSGR